MDFIAKLGQFPTLETPNYILREVLPQDAEALLAYYNNPAVYQYLDWHGPQTLARAQEIIGIWRSGFDQGWLLRFAIVSKASGQIIGTFFFQPGNDARCEIGFELAQPYWQQGIMSEVCAAMLPFGFERLGLHRIQAIVNPANLASRHLLTKLGFQFEALLKQYEYHEVTQRSCDMEMYCLLRDV